MILPQNAIKLIAEYSKPITRSNWRKGSYCNNAYKYSNLMTYLHTTTLCLSAYKTYKIDYFILINNKSFSEDINYYGEIIFECYSNLFPNSPKIDNFYTYLKMHNLIKLN
jgi:hypothetical protein